MKLGMKKKQIKMIKCLLDINYTNNYLNIDIKCNFSNIYTYKYVNMRSYS